MVDSFLNSTKHQHNKILPNISHKTSNQTHVVDSFSNSTKTDDSRLPFLWVILWSFICLYQSKHQWNTTSLYTAYNNKIKNKQKTKQQQYTLTEHAHSTGKRDRHAQAKNTKHWPENTDTDKQFMWEKHTYTAVSKDSNSLLPSNTNNILCSWRNSNIQEPIHQYMSLCPTKPVLSFSCWTALGYQS